MTLHLDGAETPKLDAYSATVCRNMTLLFAKSQLAVGVL
jgi:hypothetical protein